MYSEHIRVYYVSKQVRFKKNFDLQINALYSSKTIYNFVTCLFTKILLLEVFLTYVKTDTQYTKKQATYHACEVTK